MSTFLTVLTVIIFIIVLLAVIGWSFGAWLVGDERGWSRRTMILHTIGSLLATAALITFAINSGFIESDNSKHCGPGTRYVSESHYNPATKTVITDWMCVL